MDTSDQATVATPTQRLLRTNEDKRRFVAEALVSQPYPPDRPRKVGLRPGLDTWPVTRTALARAGGLNLLSADAWKCTLTPFC